MKRTTVKLPDELDAKLRHEAERRGITVSELTREAIEDYLGGTANWRTDLYATCGTVLSHAESIELFKKLGAKMTPELKSPSVEMPFDGFSQEDYAQKMIDEYKAADVDANHV